MKNLVTYTYYLLTLYILGVLLSACSSGGDDASLPVTPPNPPSSEILLPLTFNAMTADTENSSKYAPKADTGNSSTRAPQTGADAANALGSSFGVYGVKFTTASATPSPAYSPQLVFNQTPVTYAANTAGTSSSNTADWEYVDDNSGEYIRYWDQDATGYLFYAYAPAALKGANDPNPKAEASHDAAKKEGTITISNLVGGAKAPTTSAFISQPTVVNPRTGQIRYQGAATMTFQQPLARIRIGFLSGEDDYSSYSPQHLDIYDVSFAPLKPNTDTNSDGTPDATEIITKGSVVATYAWSHQPTNPSTNPFGLFGCDLKYTSHPSESSTTNALTFNNYKAYATDAAYYILYDTHYVEDALYAYATETGDEGEGKVTPSTPEATRLEKQWYYVFPQDAADWQLSIKTNVNGTEFNKTAIVPATYMRWLPNHQYTYIFKVSPESLSIVGVDVKVMNWQSGGSTESEQHHW